MSNEPESTEVNEETVEFQEQGLKTVEEVNKALGIEEEEQPDSAKPEESEDEEEEDESEDESEEASEEEEEEEDDSDEDEDEPTGEEKPDQEKEEEDVDWEKRYKDSQREVTTKFIPLQAENETLKTEREELRSLIQSDPELLERFVAVASGDVKPADVSDIDAKLNEKLAPVNKLLEKMEKEKSDAELKVIMKFEEKHPDLTNEDRSLLGTLSRSFENTLGISYSDALERAWMVARPDEANKTLTTEAEKRARVASAVKANATQTKQRVGSETPKVGVSLSPEEAKMAKNLGMTEKDYAAMKNN